MTDTKPPAYTPVRIISGEEILKIIPHREPFLLVDKVEIVEENAFCVGIKSVSVDEPHFKGHFPGRPIMPGVLILEAMAQTAAVMMMSLPETRGHLAYLAGINQARFRRLVVPGDILKLFVRILRFRGKICKLSGSAFVGEEMAAEAEFVAAVD